MSLFARNLPRLVTSTSRRGLAVSSSKEGTVTVVECLVESGPGSLQDLVESRYRDGPEVADAVITGGGKAQTDCMDVVLVTTRLRAQGEGEGDVDTSHRYLRQPHRHLSHSSSSPVCKVLQ